MAKVGENAQMSSAAPVYQIPAPDPFSFKDGDAWTKWLSRFERFRYASGLTQKPERDQVNSLLYLMGEQGEDILLSFNLSEEEKESYETVKEKFQSYFIPSRNIIYDRYKFFSRKQEEGESVENFITALHALVQYCNFPIQFQDEMVRDKIVCGIRDKQISEKLQLFSDLTLEKAVTTVRQAEMIKEQQQVFKGGNTAPLQADRIMSKRDYKKPDLKSNRGKGTEIETKHDKKGNGCFRCGSGKRHTKEQCPARNVKCHACSRTGHYSRVCRAKKKNSELNELKGDLSKMYLGSITLQEESSEISHVQENPWKVSIKVDDRPIDFKIDTGADLTVVPLSRYRQEFGGRKLERTNKCIQGPDGGPLELKGFVRCTLQYKNVTSTQDVYVVRQLNNPLLSAKASMELQLIQRINEIHGRWDPVQEFPKMFQGIGKIKKPYQIKLIDNAKPYAIAVPRRVPLPLEKKLKLTLEDMVKSGVIEPVDDPTDWCAPMVIVPKKDGQLRICVDLTELNKNIVREYYPTASVDYTLSRLKNAKMFSIIDANCGFWQIQLDKSTSHLTTFITPFGRFKFRRLPFGIKSAPEVFQKRMRETLGNMEGVVSLMDEVVIFGETEEEHDKRLKEVLSALQSAGWTLNIEKCQFRCKSIEFLGHVISEGGIKPDPRKTKAIAELPEPKDVKGVKRFLGMVNFLQKFIPGMADKARPLYELLRKDVGWMWGPQQEEAFRIIKESLCKAPELAMYDSTKPTKISADASSYGLGAVLFQRQKDGTDRPVSYASRALSETEKHYAQIVKRDLATVLSSMIIY